jgi:hypothetical protein
MGGGIYQDDARVNTTINEGYGGAISADCRRLEVSRVCGTQCSTDGFGHFMNRGGDFLISDFYSTNTSYSYFSLLLCSDPDIDGGRGVIGYDRSTNESATYLNVTEGQASEGSVIYTRPNYSRFSNHSWSFLTVVRCYGETGIYVAEPWIPQVSHSNFYNNTLAKAVVYSENTNIKILNCIFNWNSGRDFGASSASGTHRLQIIGCVFSSAAPTARSVYSTLSCLWRTSTSSLELSSFDTHSCPWALTPTFRPSQRLLPTENLKLGATESFMRTVRPDTAHHVGPTERIKGTEVVTPSDPFSSSRQFNLTGGVGPTELVDRTGIWEQTERPPASERFSASVLGRSDPLQPTKFRLTPFEHRSVGGLPTAKGIGESVLSISLDMAPSVPLVVPGFPASAVPENTRWFSGSRTFLGLTGQFPPSDSAINPSLVFARDSNVDLVQSRVFMRSVGFTKSATPLPAPTPPPTSIPWPSGSATAASGSGDQDSGASGVVASWLIGVIVGGLMLLIVIGIVLFRLRTRVVYTITDASTEEKSSDHIGSVGCVEAEERYITQEAEMSSDPAERAAPVADDDEEFGLE